VKHALHGFGGHHGGSKEGHNSAEHLRRLSLAAAEARNVPAVDSFMNFPLLMVT